MFPLGTNRPNQRMEKFHVGEGESLLSQAGDGVEVEKHLLTDRDLQHQVMSLFHHKKALPAQHHSLYTNRLTHAGAPTS